MSDLTAVAVDDRVTAERVRDEIAQLMRVDEALSATGTLV
jgi:hypothetical protein